MQVADLSGVLLVFVPAPAQGFFEGTMYGESTVYQLENFTEMGVCTVALRVARMTRQGG